MPLNKLLRTEWTSAGYDSRMGSAEVTRPPAPHLIRVYHLTSAVHGIGAIALQRLKVSRLSDLNDPFEFLGLMWRDLRLRSKVQALKDEVGADTGLLCFSENWINPVLWSHYADKHRGVCLGFNVVRSSARPVTYQATRIPSKAVIPIHASAALEEKLLFTKFEHWRYESERCVRVPLSKALTEGSLHFKPFGTDLALAEVILGDACTLSLDAVRSLVSSIEPSAVTFRARLAGKSYNVVPDGHSVP